MANTLSTRDSCYYHEVRELLVPQREGGRGEGGPPGLLMTGDAHACVSILDYAVPGRHALLLLEGGYEHPCFPKKTPRPRE